MPYISLKDRIHFDPAIDNIIAALGGPGDLNYVITKLAHGLARIKGKNYAAYNEVIGALECAKLEMYRHIIGPYEDTKIEANGDVL